jgi:hypothetical protein
MTGYRLKALGGMGMPSLSESSSTEQNARGTAGQLLGAGDRGVFNNNYAARGARLSASSGSQSGVSVWVLGGVVAVFALIIWKGKK